MRSILLTLVLACSALGQTYSYIATTGDVSLSSATTAATLQQPASGGQPVSFPIGAGASVYCSVACTATITVGSSSTGAATTTAGTVNKVSINFPAAIMNFFTASNVSGGTTQGLIHVLAGQTFPIDLSTLNLPAGIAYARVTISIASITGTANISFYPLEQH